MTKQSLKKENFALVLTGEEEKRRVLSALKYAGWLEFRVDEFLKKFPEEQLTKWFSIPVLPSPLPVRRRVSGGRGECPGEGDKSFLNRIGTVRWKKEHQSKGLDITEKERFEIYGRISGFVDCLDVEINSSIAGDVIGLAGSKGKRTIVSYHNFSRTPSRKELERVYRQGRKLRPDIIKVATLARSGNELLELLDFTCVHARELPLVVIPMGVPVLQRLMPVSFGSLFTYASLEKKTAPGQVSYRVLRELLRMPF